MNTVLKILNEKGLKKFVDLHVHSQDRYDSQNDPKPLCDRMVELGAEGFALTQHGVVSNIESMKVAADLAGLKFVPGIETYYEVNGVKEHLVLLSVNDTGYKVLGMAITDANDKDGYSVMNEDILNQYFAKGKEGHGNVIAMSACIGGVIAKRLLANEVIEKEIVKLEKRQSIYTNPKDERIGKLRLLIDELTTETNQKIELRDKAKKLADANFTAREKSVAKLKEKDDPSYEIKANELASDKEASDKANVEFEGLKKEVAALLKKKKANEKELKELDDRAAKFTLLQSEIDVLKEQLKTAEELRYSAVEETKKFVKIFGEGNFYMELQYHGIDVEKQVMPVLAEIAEELHVPVVATNDVHTITNSEDELLRRQIMRSMRFDDNWSEDMVGDDELYIKTNEELAEMLCQILPEDVVTEAMLNTKVILDRCNMEWKTGKHYPKYPSIDGKTSEEMLDDAVAEGVKWRFPEGMDEEHTTRLKYELGIIKPMGYSDYHLIVKDFLEYGRALAPVPANRLLEAPLSTEAVKKWCKENGWEGGFSIGPGRGSAVGSLVCYCLGITSLDPIKYDLLFERFLNPERISMPDIDSDIAKLVRPQLIKYVQNKYGENAVCGILTTNAQAPKGCIRIAAKYYGLKTVGNGTAYINLGDTMAKKVPAEVGTMFDTPVSEGSSKTVYQALQEEYDGNADALEILRWSKVLEGTFTSYGAHAAGVVISDNANVKEYLPLRWNDSLKEWTTQCDMVVTEEKGMLKMDFLGLKTLDVITQALQSIKKRTGKVIDPLMIPMDDKKVFKEIFKKALTAFVFQFSSPGMKQMLSEFGPDTFEDLIILVSMFRPGPLQFLPSVIDVKNGRKEMTFLCPELKPILGKTYGAIVYQEQVMEIFQELAGYTLGGADQVRRYMSKKKAAKLAHEKESFIFGDESRGIKGCIANGISESVASKLFEQMEEFARYAFNKSHAAAYAANAYYTAWLKCYYPADFLMGAMNWATNDEIPELMAEAKTFGVEVDAPSINYSESGFSVNNEKIVFGLSAVKAVGASADVILEEKMRGGAFTSLKDFFSKVTVKKNAIENLIKAGAFDEFSSNRAAMLLVAEDFKSAIKKVNEKRSFITVAETMLPYVDSIKNDEALIAKQQELDVSCELKKVTTSAKLEKRIDNAKKVLSEAEAIVGEIIVPSDMPEDKQTRMADEKEFLGAYVTAHPLDEYPTPSELGATSACAVTESTTRIFGVITNLQLKNRKADGKPMAFFDVEDMTGVTKVNCYTKQFARLAPFIKEGAVVLLRGRGFEEETPFFDDNGQPIILTKFIVEQMNYVEKEKSTVIMNVSSYAKFHIEAEQAFKQAFGEKNGHKLIIHDSILDEMREMNYRVSDEFLSLKAVSEMN